MFLSDHSPCDWLRRWCFHWKPKTMQKNWFITHQYSCIYIYIFICLLSLFIYLYYVCVHVCCFERRMTAPARMQELKPRPRWRQLFQGMMSSDWKSSRKAANHAGVHVRRLGNISKVPVEDGSLQTGLANLLTVSNLNPKSDFGNAQQQ